MQVLESLEQNPFFSGGLTLMVIGMLGALLRNLPASILRFLERQVSISVEVPDRDAAFAWLKTWLAEQQYVRRARNLCLSTLWVSADPNLELDPYADETSSPASLARFVLSPAPGVHLMTFRGRSTGAAPHAP